MEIHDDFSGSMSRLVLRIRAILGHMLYLYIYVLCIIGRIMLGMYVYIKHAMFVC